MRGAPLWFPFATTLVQVHVVRLNALRLPMGQPGLDSLHIFRLRLGQVLCLSWISRQVIELGTGEVTWEQFEKYFQV